MLLCSCPGGEWWWWAIGRFEPTWTHFWRGMATPPGSFIPRPCRRLYCLEVTTHVLSFSICKIVTVGLGCWQINHLFHLLARNQSSKQLPSLSPRKKMTTLSVLWTRWWQMISRYTDKAIIRDCHGIVRWCHMMSCDCHVMYLYGVCAVGTSCDTLSVASQLAAA